MHQRKMLGDFGENFVAQWLKENGYTILFRNYNVRQGEVDIIASQNDIIAFVEVKTRASKYFPLAQTVTLKKQQRIIKASRHYILTHNIQDKVFRFDVATILLQGDDQQLEYIPNAFTASY